MIEIIKSKLFNRENIKYTIVAVALLIGITLVIIYTYIGSTNNGLVINGNRILENLQKDKIGVYIDGEVNKSGYIQIPKGSTLEYAINQAEGITKDADIQNIDLDRVLKNQEKIIVPRIKEEIELESGIEDDNLQNNSTLVNINTASVEELTKLEGIGEKTAENIIQYRESNSFNSIEEIMEVKGIGEGKFEKIKEEICV